MGVCIFEIINRQVGTVNATVYESIIFKVGESIILTLRLQVIMRTLFCKLGLQHHIELKSHTVPLTNAGR